MKSLTLEQIVLLLVLVAIPLLRALAGWVRRPRLQAIAGAGQGARRDVAGDDTSSSGASVTKPVRPDRRRTDGKMSPAADAAPRPSGPGDAMAPSDLPTGPSASRRRRGAADAVAALALLRGGRSGLRQAVVLRTVLDGPRALADGAVLPAPRAAP
jgi:hypothetical protein